MIENSEERQRGICKEGAVALVTGATRGIGRACAEALLARGLKVICAGRRGDLLEKIFSSYGDAALALTLDVTDGEAVAALPTTLPGAFSEIDILIAAAGSDIGGRRRFDEGDIADWAGTIDTNVTGLMRVCHAVIPGMLARGSGHVVTLGSIAGLRTYAGGSSYGPSKYAVRAFTEALCHDYKHDPLRITEILPGLVRTSFAEARHRGDSERAAAFYDAAAASLTAADIVAAVLFALDQPESVNISQIVVTPTGDK